MKISSLFSSTYLSTVRNIGISIYYATLLLLVVAIFEDSFWFSYYVIFGVISGEIFGVIILDVNIEGYISDKFTYVISWPSNYTCNPDCYDI